MVCMVVYLSLLFATLSACGRGSDSPSVRFVDATEEVGIHFSHTSGARGDYFLFETMGSGAAFLDYDRDGWLDIYLVDGFDLLSWNGVFSPSNSVAEDEKGHWVKEGYQAPLRFSGRVDSSVFLIEQNLGSALLGNRLLRNQQGNFSDVSDLSGAGDKGYGMGIAVGDYDNDGFADLYVTNYGANALYRNDGNGFFLAETERAGVGDPHWGSSSAFFDADNDGDLDLYVTNYLDASPTNNRLCGGAVSAFNSSVGRALLVPRDRRTYCSPRRYNGAPDVLYRNDGEGEFSDVTRSSGVFSVYGKGLGVAAADYDLDGDVDLFIANDGMRNFFYQNEQSVFVERALEAGLAYNGQGQPEAGMGIAVGDYDYDRDVDLLVTNFSRESNTLYNNEGNGQFSDQSDYAGLQEDTMLPLGFGAFFFDADNDADLDIFIANGHVLDRVDQQDADLTYRQANQLFLFSDSTFYDASSIGGSAFRIKEVSRGAAVGDYDNDGDQDVLVTNGNGPAKLYRNNGDARNWISVELVGSRDNRDAVGASVILECEGVLQTRQRIGGGSYLSTSDARLHFGLGDCTQVDMLEVVWPSGQKQVVFGLSANQFIKVIQE